MAGFWAAPGVEPWAEPGRGEGGSGCCWAPALLNKDVGRLAEGPPGVGRACVRDDEVGGA